MIVCVSGNLIEVRFIIGCKKNKIKKMLAIVANLYK
jgi:hypothetical protein